MRARIHFVVALGMTSLVTSLVTSSVAQLKPAPEDFDNTAWGMTQARVMAARSAKLSAVRESDGAVIVRYEDWVYIFVHNTLVRAKYTFTGEHSVLNDFIADFRNADARLTGKHGEPARERAVWTDDSLQEESISYLEQDRARSSDILPSDTFAGVAISRGHLKLYTQWCGPRARILHALTGENGRILHQIEYSSAEWEASQPSAAACAP